MKNFLIQSLENSMDCYLVSLDDSYIVKTEEVPIDELIDSTSPIASIISNKKPDIKEAYFQVGPNYYFRAWNLS